MVFHFSLKGAVARDHSFSVVCHCFIEDSAANCRIRFNRTRHRLCPRSITVLGIGVTEIIRSIRQSQCLGAAIVTPAVAIAVGSAVVGADRVAVLHDEFAGAELHGLVRHGEFHGRLFACIGVAALAVAIADGLAVQAVYLGVGSDGHFLRLARFDHDVGGPIRRHIVDFLDLGFGGGCIPSDVVATCYVD